MPITVIPTRYKGRFFRSRLEARWGKFFDEMGFRFNYEPEGFKLTDGTCYLPDFYLSDYNWFAEVKPNIAALVENPKSFMFAKDTGLNVLVLDGEPDYRSYTGFTSFDCEGKTTFAEVQYSLDVDYHGTRDENRFFSDPHYTPEDFANPLAAFSPRYQTAANAALSERFEAA